MTRDFLIDGRDQPDFSPLEQEMVDVLRGIYDPEIPIPIWDMGLIYGWEVEEGESGHKAVLRMTLTAPNCPAAETLPAEVREGIKALDGISHVAVDLVFVPTYSMEMLSEEARLSLGFM